VLINADPTEFCDHRSDLVESELGRETAVHFTLLSGASLAGEETEGPVSPG